MAFTLLFQEFKGNCQIENAIINYYRKNNEFVINIYCLNKDIDLQKGKDRLMILFFTASMDLITTYIGKSPK